MSSLSAPMSPCRNRLLYSLLLVHYTEKYSGSLVAVKVISLLPAPTRLQEGSERVQLGHIQRLAGPSSVTLAGDP